MRSLLPASLLLLFGCPTPAPPQEDAGVDAGAELTVVELCTRLSAARCELFSRCYPAFQREADGSCRAALEARCLAEYDNLRPYFSAGNVEIDSAQVLACEERMRGSLCAPTFPPGYPIAQAPFSDCELTGGLLRGKVASGQTCEHPVECAQGTLCVKPGGVCRGTCASYSREGEPCGLSCARGLYCADQDTQDPTDDRCAPPRGLNAPCTSSLQCEASLYCRAGSCRPRGKLGEACLFDPERLATCDPGLACDVAPFVEAQIGKCILPAGQGQSCNFHWSCAAGLVCFDLDFAGFPSRPPAPGSCQPPGLLGANCTFTSYAAYLGDQCAPGTYCSGDTRKCAPIPSLGEACTPSSQSCAGLGVFCKPSGGADTGTCSRPPNLNERCAYRLDDQRVDAIPCASGWCDTKGTLSCLPPNRVIGEVCQSNGECLSNRCAVQQDRSQRCAPSCQ